MYKIGIVANECLLPDGRNDYVKTKSHGYDCVDFGLMVNPNGIYYSMTDDELKKAMLEERARILDAGLEISQAHATWPVDDSTAESRKAKMVQLKKSILAASFVQSKYVVVHPSRIYGFAPDGNYEESPDMLDQNACMYRELCEYGAQLGVGICIENMPFGPNFSLSTVKQVMDFVDTYNIPNLSVCFDTGHAWLYGEKPADVVRMLGKRLTTLHVQDGDGVQDRHWLPFRGKIPWDGFGTALKEIGFENPISLETRARNYTTYPPQLMEYFEIGLAKIARAMWDL